MKKHKIKQFKNICVGSRVHWYQYSSDMIIIAGGRGIVIDIFNIDTQSDSPLIMFSVLDDSSLNVRDFSYFDIQPEEQ